MQIVIDIPKETYGFLQKYGTDGSIVEKAVLNGTPLPKGHGRLIDADELYNELEFPTQKFASAFKQVLDDAPTIIEAERSDKK